VVVEAVQQRLDAGGMFAGAGDQGRDGRCGGPVIAISLVLASRIRAGGVSRAGLTGQLYKTVCR